MIVSLSSTAITMPISAPLFAALLFPGMLICLEIGRRIGRRHRDADPEGATAGTGAVDGAIFALFGLLVAFTFSGAAARFDTRRALIVEEANNIGSAWLQIDLLPMDAQDPMRDIFRRYTDARIKTYRKLPDVTAAETELAESMKLQGEIWKQAVAACEAKHDPATTTLFLDSLNDMFDITTTRTAALRRHPPLIIYQMLFALGLGCSLLAGFGMARSRSRSWIHIVAFAAVTAIAVYVILELEYPRFGIIRLDKADLVLEELRESMK